MFDLARVWCDGVRERSLFSGIVSCQRSASLSRWVGVKTS
jgi:hypothetical protein